MNCTYNVLKQISNDCTTGRSILSVPFACHHVNSISNLAGNAHSLWQFHCVCLDFSSTRDRSVAYVGPTLRVVCLAHSPSDFSRVHCIRLCPPRETDTAVPSQGNDICSLLASWMEHTLLFWNSGNQRQA